MYEGKTYNHVRKLKLKRPTLERSPADPLLKCERYSPVLCFRTLVLPKFV